MADLVHLLLPRQNDLGSGAGNIDTPADDPCGPSPTSRLGLRIAAIFIILVTSLFGTLFPILSKRQKHLRKLVPGWVFEFAKYFGSGVILATSLIHLLEPATEEIGEINLKANGGCIADSWGEYPYPFGICLISLYLTFVLEMVAFRIGTNYMKSHALHLGIATEPNGITKIPDAEVADKDSALGISPDSVAYNDSSSNSPAMAQIIGVAILEIGVIFHSLFIGLTLATSSTDEFTTLFIVIIFHQMFEGLGLGTRLAFLQLGDGMKWVPYAGALTYAIITPLGMSIGLGVRESLSLAAAGSAISSGILDSISAGILLYTATVELIAHEFVFNDYYHKCSWQRLVFVMTCFAFGAGIMALLGKWA